MKITTSQEQSEADCCGCLVSCNAPRKECESITLTLCGFQLETNEGLTTEDYCRRFKKQLQEESKEETYVYGSPTTTRVYTLEASTLYEYELAAATFAAGACGDYDIVSASWDEQTTWSSSAETASYSTTGSITAGVDNGEHTIFTTTQSGGGFEFDSDYCTILQNTAYNHTVDTSTPGQVVYTRTADYGSGGTETTTKTFSDELDFVNQMDAVSFPDDVNGSECSSKIECAIGTQSRYRFGVPFGYSTEEMPRSTWEMEWDEATASADWWEWFDTGMTGTEPTPGPTLTPRSWIWAGDMGEPWSNWFELSMPEEAGENRVINVMVKCFNSNRLGVKPTASGDSYNPAA